jgi:hypothetical protein
MRKIVLASLLYFVGNSYLTCSQTCVTVHAKQDKVANSIEKMETDKWVRYSLSNQSQEVFVYKLFRETGKTVSFIINAVDPKTLCRVILMKFKDNAFVSLQKAYEQQEKTAASSC